MLLLWLCRVGSGFLQNLATSACIDMIRKDRKIGSPIYEPIEVIGKYAVRINSAPISKHMKDSELFFMRRNLL